MRHLLIAAIGLSLVPRLAIAQNPPTPLSLDYYNVQCGILSSEGLPEGANPRLTPARDCKLAVAFSDADVTTFDLTGTIGGQKISWTFEGDAKSNVFKQIAPQVGGKFNRSVRGGLACFVAFDTTNLDDVDSLVCYRRSTLRKIHGWDRRSGRNFPIP